MSRILLALLLSQSASAGWWNLLCENNLISEDPHPYADTDFETMLNSYAQTHDSKMLKEIIFRLRSGMLTPEQEELFWRRFGK